MKILIFVIGLLLVSACSQKSSDLESIESRCEADKKASEGFCECLVSKAEEELTDEQIAFVASGFEKDKPRIESLKKSLGMEGILVTGVFMAKAATVCAVENE